MKPPSEKQIEITDPQPPPTGYGSHHLVWDKQKQKWTLRVTVDMGEKVCGKRAASGRRLVPFRNCFCGVQSVKFYDGQFLCQRHYEADRSRYLQDPAVTAENIRACNARCERERYARLAAAGLCVTCGKRPNYEGCKRCHECQAKRRAYRGKLIGGEHQWKTENRIFFAQKRSA